jgi:uncharacterized protein YdeI (YjbR/CyaY-like superfamily)
MRRANDSSTKLVKSKQRSGTSLWSKINRKKAEALIANEDMKPAGLASMEQAKQSGRWNMAYDSPRSAAVPSDFQIASDASPKAKAFF